jgi:hypothetical protein
VNPSDRGGGSFVVQPDGTVDRAGGTVPHPEGDAPRTADGQVVRDGAVPAPTPMPSKPAKRAVKEA